MQAVVATHSNSLLESYHDSDAIGKETPVVRGRTGVASRTKGDCGLAPLAFNKQLTVAIQ